MGLEEKTSELFLISSSGVPKHWTTSVNNGDTNIHVSRRDGTERQKTIPTVIAHSDIGDNLLQDCLALHVFLVLRLCCLQLGAEFLSGSV